MASAKAKAAAKKPSLVEELARTYFDLFMYRTIAIEQVMAECGVTVIQARTLMLMGSEQPTRMRDVAELVGCGPSNLTGIVDKLEARRLVNRTVLTEDRRTKLLKLTPAGKVLRERILTRFSASAPWMSALTAAEQRTLHALLKKGLAFSQAHGKPFIPR